MQVIMTNMRKVFLFLSLSSLLLTACNFASNPNHTPSLIFTKTVGNSTSTAITVFPSETRPGDTSNYTIDATITATQSPTLRFAVIGDYGDGNDAEKKVADLILGWAPDLILTTGDNNYPKGSAESMDKNIGQYFQSFIHPYQGIYGLGADENRFFPSLGNHDWSTDQAQPYLDYFQLPGNERYYEIQKGLVSFFILDSDAHEPDGVGISSDQAAWLKSLLSSSKATWNIVCFHHPPYSSGLHGSTTWMRWPFREWGTDLVLSGHDHTYERILVDNLTYIVTGLGGANIYDFGQALPGSQVRYNQDHGAMLVTAASEWLEIQFITWNGDIIDDVTLTADNP